MRTLQPAAHGKPCALLEPLVDALLDRGASLVRAGEGGTAFAPSPEGWIAVIDQPIDWDWVVAHFELPAPVRFDAARDMVIDDESWTAIYGSGGALALTTEAPRP